MKRILVPTDFSSCAAKAIDFAAKISQLTQAEIILMHSFETMGPVYTDYMGINVEYHQKQMNENIKKLEEIKKSIKEKQKVDISLAMYSGSVKNNILQAIEDKGIDIVVMGTLGATGLKEKIWGSNTVSIAGKSNIPLIVIPADYKWSPPGKILFTTNNFEEDPKLLNLIFEMSHLFLAKVYVAVFSDENTDTAIKFMANSRQINEYEEKLRKKYKDDTLTAVHLSGKDFENTLANHLHQNKIDMLAMITYQRNFIQRIFNPSMTRKMAYHTEIPLLIIPAAEKEKTKGEFKTTRKKASAL
jgi:nucleotide-binding universal stress UspA family protein